MRTNANRPDAQTDGAYDLAEQAERAEEEGVTFRVKQDDEDPALWYAHISRPGRPGIETERYLSLDHLRNKVMADWPKAVELGCRS